MKHYMADKAYVFDNARLMSEWDWEENDRCELDPKKLTLGSGKKANWVCTKGHKWVASIGFSRGSLYDFPCACGPADMMENGSVSHTSYKHKTGVQLFGSSDGCTPAFLYSDSGQNSFGNF